MNACYLGIDLGVADVKVVLVDAGHRVVADALVPLSKSTPQPRWHEQSPEEWWHATVEAIGKVKADEPAAFARLAGIGVSGQTQGLVLLDKHDRVLRPAILWNDSRALAECVEIEALVTDSRRITGNAALPGFSAPKLLWLQKYEPSVFDNIARVIMPKDYIVFRLTGELCTDMSDASSTLCLDVVKRDWSDRMLHALGMDRAQFPRLLEGSSAVGSIALANAEMWGIAPNVPVSAGAGRPAGNAVGLGAVSEGEAYVSLATSGLVFVTTNGPRPCPERAVRNFAHCLPGKWLQLGVVPAGTASLDWWARILGVKDRAFLADQASSSHMHDAPIFLPYLNGACTPHNDAKASGVFFGLTEETTPGDFAYALLEGVAFCIADSLYAIRETGTLIRRASLIGEGARNRLWAELLVTACGIPLDIHEETYSFNALGAAALARAAATGEAASEFCRAPAVKETILPREDWREQLGERFARFRRLYRSLQAEFSIHEPVT